MAVAPLGNANLKAAMEAESIQRFVALAEKVIRTAEQLTMAEPGTNIGAHVSVSHLNLELQDLSNESAKCKSLRVIHLVSLDRIQAMLKTMEDIIQSTLRILSSSTVDTKDASTLMVAVALNASLAALHVMTSQNIQPTYTDETIESIVTFIRHCLEKLAYSPDNIKCNKDMSDDSKSRNNNSSVERNSSVIFKKVYDCIGLLSELVHSHQLIDTVMFHVSCIGVRALCADATEGLNFIAMKLIIETFIKYKSNRYEILHDALSSLMKLSEKRSKTKIYKLRTGENIQMYTALIVHLMHAAADFPTERTSYSKQEMAQTQNKIFNNMLEAYTVVFQMTAAFNKELVKRCCSNTDKADNKAIFKNIVDDLLLMFNKPEWSGAELILEILGKALICNIANHSNNLSLRSSCLDYLGVMAARLRREILTSQDKLNAVDQIIQQHRDLENDIQTDLEDIVKGLNSEEHRIIYSQDIILNYLTTKTQDDDTLIYARNFTMCYWYHETFLQKSASSIQESSKEESTADKKCIKSKNISKLPTFQRAQEWIFLKAIKNILYKQYKPEHIFSHAYIDYNSINLLSEYVACNRSVLKTFERYMQQILLALTESSVLLRSKAVKGLVKIIQADPLTLGRCDMQKGMQHCFLDRAAPVREAAIDLIGKYILLQPEFIDQYYSLLSSRMMDAGISVRKRVISIFRDICIEHPQHPKVPEICLQIIQRVHDEEGVKKLVVQAFQKIWFTPIIEEMYLESNSLLNKVTNIMNVVGLSLDMGMESLDDLLAELFRSFPHLQQRTVATEVPSTIIAASQQIVDCLAQKILKLETVSNLGTCTQSSSESYVLCFITLQRFAAAHPSLLVKYALILGPYLSMKCQTVGDYQIITSVAHIMEVTVPLMEHPSETFLAQVEEDTIKVVLQHDQRVVASCISCLASLVKKVTKNYELIRDTFFTFYEFLQTFKCDYEKEPSLALLEKNRPLLQRALFTSGLFLRYFDFTDKSIFRNIEENVMDQIYEKLLYFAVQLDDCLQTYALKAIGLMCVRYSDYMLQNSLIALYHQHLKHAGTSINMKMQVLKNIELYLQEEAKSVCAQERQWLKQSNEENLKYMCDTSSGMASTVMQLYIQEILNCYIHDNVQLRQAVSRIIQLVLQQGLLQPMQIIPFLIAMSTDTDQSISFVADQQLKLINIKYPGFVATKLLSGLWLSHKIQSILQQSSVTVKGYKVDQNLPKALNTLTYLILCKTQQQRRAFVFTLLKQFDDQMNTSLSQMRYLVDNLAYFPYRHEDEPLFIIHHIDIILATCGNNILQSFEEALLLKQSQDETGAIIDIESEEQILQLIPKDTTALHKYIIASKGCLLLLQLKNHLMEQYGISNIKIAHYSTSDPSKKYEKPINQHHAVQLFEPKVANEDTSSHEKKRLLVKEYLQFKRTMLKIETVDSDDDLEESSSVNPKKSVRKQLS